MSIASSQTRLAAPLAPILIVDDDPGQRSLLESFLQGEDFATLTAATGAEALAILDARPVQMMICDVRMPGLSGLETLRRARQTHKRLPVLLVTAYADIRDAVHAMRDGAVNYLQKPIDLDELLASVRQAIGLGRAETPRAAGERPLPPHVVALSPLSRDVFREAALVAPSDVRVLITGESGVGKEVIADLIHAWSPRAAGPLIKVNCAAIPETLLESELFGHEKGAFTGAVAQRAGRFEEARGGTLLLDEVAEMSPALQAKLLRVTQDGSFQRVGSGVERKTDARVLAATNRDLEQEVAAGRFREDLFFRLNVVEIHVPPLRERPEEILALADAFVRQLGGGGQRLSPSTVACLQNYNWPGNVRELRNAIERAMLMARGKIILPEHLPRRIQQARAPDGAEPPDSGPGRRMEDVERAVILQTLRENRYQRTETARVLGISRRTLIYKLRRLAEQGYPVDPP